MVFAKKLKLILEDEVNCRFEGLEQRVKSEIDKALKKFIPTAKFAPSYKMGYWDGYEHFFFLMLKIQQHILIV